MGKIISEHLYKSFITADNINIYKILKKEYESTQVLEDINISINAGEIYGVLGRNGAGKSTLLRTLGGIYSYDGKLFIDGKITSIFELGSFLDVNQTGREYCKEFFYITMEKYNKNQVEELISDIKDFTELEDYFDEPIYKYSSGMKAKLLFATVTALKAEVVLIDEALVVGDMYFQGKAWRRLRNLLRKGTAGIIVSHDWVALLRICQKAYIMDKGKIVYSGDIRNAIDEYVGFTPLQVEKIRILNKEQLQKKQFLWTNRGEFDFDIEVMEMPTEKDIEIGLLIERFIPGAGWDVIYVNGAYFRLKNTGIYHIHTIFPDLKLQKGTYNIGLHIFKKYMDKQTGQAEMYDRMTWIEHYDISAIINEGEDNEAILRRQLKWTILSK